MGKEKRVVDGKEIEVNVEIVDGKEVVTPIQSDKKDKPLTQEAFDSLFKKMKDAEERLERSETEKVDLVERVKKLEEKGFTTTTTDGDITTKVYGQRQDGTWVFPNTEEEWDDLIAERPTFGTDLRSKYNELTSGKTKEIRKAQLESALRVANTILPEMYKKDAEGNLLIDKNGSPVPDDKSDIFKVFCQIAADEGIDENGKPVILTAKNGPELVALKVKQVLGTERETELKRKAEQEMEDKGKERDKRIKDGQTAPPGQVPTVTKPKVNVTFSSDYEKQRAEEKVAKGVYKDLEEYCRIRDNNAVPYGRGGV